MHNPLDKVFVEPQRSFAAGRPDIDIQSRWMHLYKLVRVPPEQLVLAEMRIYHNPLHCVESLHPLVWCARVSLFETPDKPYCYSVYDISTKKLHSWLHTFNKFYVPRAKTPLLVYRNHTDYCMFLQRCIQAYRHYDTESERHYLVYLAAGHTERWVTETAVLTVPNYPEVIDAFESFLSGVSTQHLFYDSSPPLIETLHDLASI